MNITSHFISAVKQYPHKIALIENRDSISYSSLLNEVKETAAYFIQKGIEKGDRVLVFIPMSMDLYRVVLALFYIGATAVFLDEWVNKKRMELCCSLADCRGFIGIPKAKLFSLFSKELRKIPVKLKISGRSKTKVELAKITEEDSALITFTTGSTGTPKAANRTHVFLNEQFTALIEEIKPEPEDIDMTLLPIVLFLNLGIGCTSVIGKVKMNKIATANLLPIVEQITNHCITRITASPSFFNTISQHLNNYNLQLDYIEKIFTGGGPVFPEEALNFEKSFPNADIKIVYGSTEAEPISSISSSRLIELKNELKKGLPVGQINPNIKLKTIPFQNDSIPEISNAELDKLSVSPGKMGELIVAGNHVLKNYYKNEKAFERNKIVTEDIIWHRTGDCGFIENDILFLAGRCEQMIKKEGVSFSPFVIEHQLSQITEINLGTVLLIENKVTAIIETNSNTEVITTKLAHFNFDEIKIVAKIPRDARHNTKIDYGRLKELIL